MTELDPIQDPPVPQDPQKKPRVFTGGIPPAGYEGTYQQYLQDKESFAP